MTDQPDALAALIAAADRAHGARDWALAATLFRRVLSADPARATAAAVPLGLGHCLIEGAAVEADLAGLGPLFGQGDNGEPRLARVAMLRLRAIELCRAGDFARASRLLQFLCGQDWSLATAYAEGLKPGRTACADLPDTTGAAAGDPPFLAEPGVATLDPAAVAARHRGRPVLLVMRQMFGDAPARRHEMADNMAAAAAELGLAVHRLDSHFGAALRDPAGIPERLAATIDALRPAFILYDDPFVTGVSAEPARSDAIAAVLRRARRGGARVVATFPDAWMVPPDGMARGLGDCIDLIHHMSAPARDRAGAAERAATLCFPFAYRIAAPATPPGVIPGAAFVGSLHVGSAPRLFWWAEAGRAGLPLRVLETDHAAAAQRSDRDYADLLRAHQVAVSLTRRTSGSPIMTGRSVETLLAGGVLLEEDSEETRHFLRPGLDYLPFRTLFDLAALLDRLLRDAPLRARLAASGEAWARRWFTGDRLWALLLDRLERLPPA